MHMAKTATIDIPVSGVPQVQELAAKLAEAQAELAAAEAELDYLSSILNPLPWTSTHTPAANELDALKALRQEPIARERYLMAKVLILEITPRYERARSEALRQLTEQRKRARLPLLRRFADALDAAKTIGDELLAFDLQTVRLGGSNPGHPFGQLLDDPPYRIGDASRVRVLVDQLENE